ncbi:hypothetical protein CJ178_23360 [Rhodococcus sp. ACPA4]|uniref:Uncharacterized protein n=2 Tax=Rhodococcus globerulus TaxID=33008 RepID=A0ABU4BWP6_RHOGO|nr:MULTISPECIES: hypothetical protein [Rhodococcus]NMD60457.1 hypothetical protein [Nocardia globerula]MCE4264330.1 hypothetical protein [Rhodococcus globerulus]MDV6268651.1 hypothetical protein [Rhodococcus globerulus]MDV8067371.1 hypothetical protein [Rhodococcus sp. IEGM 1366]NRI65754.1 hypothetical protein [Rhodococcus sp. MS16]
MACSAGPALVRFSGKDLAIAAPRADVALAVAAATVLGVGIGVLLTDVLAGLAVGLGAAVLFRFALRMINTRR